MATAALGAHPSGVHETAAKPSGRPWAVGLAELLTSRGFHVAVIVLVGDHFESCTVPAPRTSKLVHESPHHLGPKVAGYFDVSMKSNILQSTACESCCAFTHLPVGQWSPDINFFFLLRKHDPISTCRSSTQHMLPRPPVAPAPRSAAK